MRQVARSYLLARGTARTLALGAAVDSTGTGLFLGLLPLYLVLQLGVPAGQVGLVVGAANVLGLLAAVPAGRVVDVLGPTRTWRAVVALRAVGYAGFLFIDSFAAYALLTCALVPLDRVSGVAQQSFVVMAAPPAERNVLMAGVRTFRNVGMSIGLMLSGVVVTVGTQDAYRLGLLVNVLSYAVFLGTIIRAGREATSSVLSSVEHSTRGQTRDSGGPWRDRRYLGLTMGDALLMLHDSVLFVLFPLWIVERTAISPVLVGPLLAVNTVLTVALQAPLARMANDLTSAQRLIVRSVGPLLLACLLLASAEHAPLGVATALVVLGILALTIGENLHSTGAFEMSHRAAPADQIGRYLGFFSMGNTAQLIAGPPMMTVVVLGAGPTGWAVLGACFASGAALMGWGGRGATVQQHDHVEREDL